MKFSYWVSVQANYEHHMLTVRARYPDHARLKTVKGFGRKAFISVITKPPARW